jgi:hypothetical protein
VDRRDDVAPRLERDRVSLACKRCEAGVRVGHHVSHDVDLARDSLVAEGVGRPLVGAEQIRGDRVDLDARVLLRHRQVAAAQAGLDVRQRDAGRHGRPCSRERGVRVAVHEHEAGILVADERLDRARHRLGVSRLEVEPVLRLREPELLEEHLRELAVVVLARVEYDLVDGGRPQRLRQGRALDELRAVAHDGDDSHRGQASPWVGRSPGVCPFWGTSRVNPERL